MSDNRRIDIIGGGTVNYVANHFALTAPAYGTTAKDLYNKCYCRFDHMDVRLHLTKMAGGEELETNDDIKALVEQLVADSKTRVIFMPVALCDWQVAGGEKYADRRKTSQGGCDLHLVPAPKIISEI